MSNRVHQDLWNISAQNGNRCPCVMGSRGATLSSVLSSCGHNCRLTLDSRAIKKVKECFHYLSKEILEYWRHQKVSGNKPKLFQVKLWRNCCCCLNWQKFWGRQIWPQNSIFINLLVYCQYVLPARNRYRHIDRIITFPWVQKHTDVLVQWRLLHRTILSV